MHTAELKSVELAKTQTVRKVRRAEGIEAVEPPAAVARRNYNLSTNGDSRALPRDQ